MKKLTFEQIKSILKDYTVGIAGAGGLGSNCAVALARVGIGKIVVADFDVVSKTNLNRQYFFLEQLGLKKVDALKINIEKINPAVAVETHDKKVTVDNAKDIFSGCDVLVEAFDLPGQKQMIIEFALEHFPGKPLITGSGIAGYGSNESIKMRQIDNLYICGDEHTETEENVPPLAPRVAMVANMQANQVLELIIDNKI